MSFEQFLQKLFGQRERRARESAELKLFDATGAQPEADVGAIRLLRLQAALRERRVPEAKG